MEGPGLPLDPDALRRAPADLAGLHGGQRDLAAYLDAEHDAPTGLLARVDADTARHGEDLVSLWQDAVNGYGQVTDCWSRALAALAHAATALGVTAGACAAEYARTDPDGAAGWSRRVEGA